MINPDYSQPFSVGRGERSKRFKGVSWDGYLPALEPKLDNPEPKEVVIVHRVSSMSAQEADMLQQAVLGIADLRKELLEKGKKKPSKYQQYDVDNPPK